MKPVKLPNNSIGKSRITDTKVRYLYIFLVFLIYLTIENIILPNKNSVKYTKMLFNLICKYIFPKIENNKIV